MRKILLPLIFAAFLFGCSSAPDHYVPRGENATIQAINNTRIDVIQEVKYNCASNGYTFPAGTYVPVASDENGTYYQSPKGIRVRVGITYFESTPYGGICIKRDAKYGTLTYLVWYDHAGIRKTDTPIAEMSGPNPSDVFILRE